MRDPSPPVEVRRSLEFFPAKPVAGLSPSILSALPSLLPQIADERRRDFILVYLRLRALVLVVSLTVLAFAPVQLTQSLSAEDHRRLWGAWILFAAWSVPLSLASRSGLRRNDLKLTDWLISLSLLPDSFAIFLAATATGGPAGAVYRSIYFLIAIHSYHFSPRRWATDPGTPQVGLLRLSSGPVLAVLCGMSIFYSLGRRATSLEPVQYGVELGLQVLIATAFLLVSLSDLKRVQILGQSQEDLGKAQRELERARATERRLLEAMQDVSSIARISDERQLDEKLQGLVREIAQNLGSEYCALGLVREGRLDVIAFHTSFPLSKKAKSVLSDLNYRPLGRGLVGSVLAGRSKFLWNSHAGRDFVDLDESELANYGLSLDTSAIRLLRDEVLASRTVRHVLVEPFYSQDTEERPLGYILLLNKRGGITGEDGFSPQDAERLNTIASQLAVAITNIEYHLRDIRHAEHETFLNSLTEDFDDLVNRVLGYLNREYSSRVASLWLATEDGFGSRDETLRVVLRSLVVAEMPEVPGSAEKLEERLKQLNTFRVDECFIGRFFRNDGYPPEVTYVEDLSSVTDSWVSCLQEIGTPHLIAIPISRYLGSRVTVVESSVSPVAERSLVGVVCLRPLRPLSITAERLAAFERLASRLAVLIDQGRFRRRYQQIEILKNQLPDLQSADLEEFYAGVVSLVRDALTAEACSFFALDLEGALILKATTAEKAIRIDNDRSRFELSTAEHLGRIVYPAGKPSITSKIAEVRKTTLLYDVYRSPYMSTLFMEVTQTPDHQSLIGAPVVQTDGTLLGVLRCINRRQASTLLPVFVQEDKEFLDLIVGIMARFIENAEASASKRAFLAQLAHELVTPLAALRNQIDFLEDVTRRGRPVRDSEEQFAYLREQSDFIQYLVSDIQYQFGRGVDIRVHYEFSKAVDLTRTMERVKKLLLLTARMDKQVDIKTSIMHMPPLYVDPRRMEQVIFNLLQNAVKYSQPGAGNIFLSYNIFQEEDLKGSPTKWHRISFENWSLGVKESDLPFIFEEYRRGTNVEGAPSGTGLGLAVAKRIVEAHGGRISVVNLKNPTIFAVDLPEELTRRSPANANPVY